MANNESLIKLDTEAGMHACMHACMYGCVCYLYIGKVVNTYCTTAAFKSDERGFAGDTVVRGLRRHLTEHDSLTN